MPIDFNSLFAEAIRGYDMDELRAIVESSVVGEDFGELINSVVEECFTGRLKTKDIVKLLRDATLEKVEGLCESEKRDLAEELGLDTDDWQQEVYEWYDVSWSFGAKLEAHGEKIVSFQGMRLWGRTCTGQAVYLDGVVGEIVRELGM
jgi:hypothetical protein